MKYKDCAAYIRQISQIRETVRGKWTLQILCVIRHQTVRPGELKRLIPSASKKAITASLRKLESAGIVVRRDMSGTILHVEYDFADDMRLMACSLLDIMADWGAILENKRERPHAALMKPEA